MSTEQLTNVKWKFHAVTGDQSSDAQNNILNYVNQSTTGYLLKFAASDQKGNDARAVVFYTESETEIPKVQPNGNTSWAAQRWESSDNYDQLYNDAANFLNTLSLEQLYFCSISFTNAQSHKALVEVYYPIL